jgi:queuine tRNA-ribosyltransferase
VSAGPGFEVIRVDASGARLGRLRTAHGVVETPAFMPVGTHGSVKVTPRQLEARGDDRARERLSPGPASGRRDYPDARGLHALMGWDGPILTDSGGFRP